MKTQGRIYLLVLLSATIGFSAEGDSLGVKFARAFGAKAKVVFRVLDDEGNPVEGARVGAGFYMNKKVGENPTASAITDKTGGCEIEGRTVSSLKYSVKKDGYYETHGRLWFAGTVKESGRVKDGKWQPYGKTYSVVLKPKKKPIPMLRHRCRRGFEEIKSPMGFDLKAGDFVAPYGTGITTDFVLDFHEEMTSFWRYRAVLRMSLTNSFDGAYILIKDSYSAFPSVYAADTNAIYKKEFVFEYDHLDSKKQGWKESCLTDDQYLVLRTRTKLDEKGCLEEAYYSKIYGPLNFIRKGFFILSYFNPEVNNPNLESNEEFFP